MIHYTTQFVWPTHTHTWHIDVLEVNDNVLISIYVYMYISVDDSSDYTSYLWIYTRDNDVRNLVRLTTPTVKRGDDEEIWPKPQTMRTTHMSYVERYYDAETTHYKPYGHTRNAMVICDHYIVGRRRAGSTSRKLDIYRIALCVDRLGACAIRGYYFWSKDCPNLFKFIFKTWLKFFQQIYAI